MGARYFFFDRELVEDESQKRCWTYEEKGVNAWKVMLIYDSEDGGESFWKAGLRCGDYYFFSADDCNGQHALNDLRSRLESAWNFIQTNVFLK